MRARPSAILPNPLCAYANAAATSTVARHWTSRFSVGGWHEVRAPRDLFDFRDSRDCSSTWFTSWIELPISTESPSMYAGRADAAARRKHPVTAMRSIVAVGMCRLGLKVMAAMASRKNRVAFLVISFALFLIIISLQTPSCLQSWLGALADAAGSAASPPSRPRRW